MARARTAQIAEAVKKAALDISLHLGYNPTSRS
jgi:hypothetical protein